MTTLAEIEAAIAKLPPAEFRLLTQRLREREAEEWDRQIEEDTKSGRLEALYIRLLEEEGAEPKVPLDQVFDDPKCS